ncbi:histidine-tRNA ligase [Pholiota conissans]|uniref:histidine--tRNA ligase n=1 Tax=Pholiota conissans TaxID=109636 RepID=A0A9P5Z829_9AGAR|nr:histidine-tRNA ligase [Pholiota conissans]
MASTTDVAALEAQIATTTAQFNELRLAGAPLDEVKKTLSDLKKALAIAKGAAGAREKKEAKETAPVGGPEKKKERLLLKTAKGTRDYGPAETACRAHIENTIRKVFTSFGGSELDTPVFERKDVLTDKYGEDSKLIFDLQDQGGEQLALRYDHTVPLARWLAMTRGGGEGIGGKLWQIGKVYRRDQPVMSKGRMREFMQADFDVAGTWDTMIPDAEILSLVSTVLSRLDVGDFTIKLNHRKILDGIFEVCGVPEAKIRSISSAVDKLDKLPWLEVRKEMTDEKGLDGAIADRIGEYVKYKGGPELLAQLEVDATLTANKNAKQGLEEMKILFTLLQAYDITGRVSFDLSLARGLDYYTGIIYEAVVEASAPPAFKAANASSTAADASTSAAAAAAAPKEPKKKVKKADEEEDEPEVDESQVGVGSIAAGGRYDGLVGAFLAGAAGANPASKEGKKAMMVGGQVGIPCVGVSIGMDRVFALLWPKWVERGGRTKATVVFVISAGDGLLEERVGLVKELREAGIKSDFLAKAKPKINAQFAAAEKDEVPYTVILGAEELAAGLVTVKDQKWDFVDGQKVKIPNADLGVKVKRTELVQWLRATDVWKASAASEAD